MQFRMIDVGEKSITRRRAVATGKIRAKAETIERVLRGELPKGDALKLAEAAGIMAAKRTSDLLPLCHPLILDAIRVSFSKMADEGNSYREIEVRCEVICHGKTGVEMEALTGVQVALLSVYDLTKAIDPALEILGIHLLEKEGGKSGHWFYPKHETPSENKNLKIFQDIRACVLTVSDRCSRGETEDLTGPRICAAFTLEGAKIAANSIVPDEINQIQNKVKTWIIEQKPDVIILTGGTGISERDISPEAMEEMWDKKIPGFGELFRRKGAEHTNMAWLSRAEAGLINKSLVVLLPGSRGAVEDGIQILKEVLPHTLSMIRGGKH